MSLQQGPGWLELSEMAEQPDYLGYYIEHSALSRERLTLISGCVHLVGEDILINVGQSHEDGIILKKFS